jgi:carotenoid cleavage dioxygenase-like enzyme
MMPAAHCSAASAESCRMRRLRPQDGGVANTNIIFHAGRLLALEEGHLPTEIEPGTLKRLGYCDYHAAIAGPFTAHPKIDPLTGEMVFFGYNAAGPLRSPSEPSMHPAW